MSSRFTPQKFFNNLPLPIQESKSLTFCPSTKATKVEEWVNGLQATKITQTSIALYKCIPELNSLKTDFDNRMKILECVRPKVQNCIEGLTNDFLHQPLILPESAQKVAIVSQALQRTMITGYLLCIRDITNSTRIKAKATIILGEALHRAITGIGLFFFRAYQLYTQSPPRMWAALHGLFQIANHFELSAILINDPETAHKATSIRDAYVKVLMLASCRANQLRQNDVERAFTAFSSWARLVKTHPYTSAENDNFYVVDLSQDSAPTYKSRVEGTELDSVIELDFKALLDLLAKHCGPGEQIIGDARIVSVPTDFPEAILSHLLSTWGNIAQRKLGRRHVNTKAEICVGLTDGHYFLSGKQDFENYINANSGANKTKNWDLGESGFDYSSDALSESEENLHPTWEITIQNVSAGGYCLLWRGKLPPRVEAGEVICLKEPHRPYWNLCVVRWIKQLKQASQLGVQLFSSHPAPCGAAQVFDMGGHSDYMRAIALPPTKHNGAPPSILMPKAPFSASQKARIMNKKKTVTVSLDKCVFSTGSIRQFLYRELEGSVSATDSDENVARPIHSSSNQDFDSSWDDI